MAYLVQATFITHGYDAFDKIPIQCPNVTNEVSYKRVEKGSCRICRDKSNEGSRKDNERFS